MKNQESIYEFEPLYHIYKRYEALLSLPEEEKDEAEIIKLKKILLREGQHYLVP
ncbi:hypothetical protein ACFLSV_07700 [Bacteroidota bacterium]